MCYKRKHLDSTMCVCVFVFVMGWRKIIYYIMIVVQFIMWKEKWEHNYCNRHTHTHRRCESNSQYENEEIKCVERLRWKKNPFISGDYTAHPINVWPSNVRHPDYLLLLSGLYIRANTLRCDCVIQFTKKKNEMVFFMVSRR